MIHFLKQWYGFAKIDTSLIYAQAKHETGDFKSAIFKENNNLFGMRQAKVRKNYATGTARGHAIFGSLFNSIRDYFERQKNFKISARSNNDFINDTVNSGYAEDKQYLKKWVHHWELEKREGSPFIKYSHYVLIVAVSFLVGYWIYNIVQNVRYDNATIASKKRNNKAVRKLQAVQFSKN